jgi:hypothetical protein
MSRLNILPREEEWLGVSKRRSTPAGRSGPSDAARQAELDDEMVRICSILKAHELVEDDAQLLEDHARQVPDRESSLLVHDLHALANRLEALGNHLVTASRSVSDIEGRLLARLNSRVDSSPGPR